MKARLLITSALTIIGFFNQPAFSQNKLGKGSTGGGNATSSGVFLDLALARNTRALDIEILKSIAQNDLNYLDQTLAVRKLPNETLIRHQELFRNDNSMSFVFSKIFEKRWSLTKNEINENACLNTTIFKTEQKIVACQDSLQVIVSEDWFTSKIENKDYESIRWMIMHEMLVDQALNYNPQILNSQAIISINQLIMDQQPTETLIRYLSHYKLGEFTTKLEDKKWKNEIEKAEKRKLAFMRECQNKNIQNYQEFFQFVEENKNIAPPEMVSSYNDLAAYNSSKLLLINKSSDELNNYINKINEDLNKSTQNAIRIFCYGERQ
jgi:hypothetical protein